MLKLLFQFFFEDILTLGLGFDVDDIRKDVAWYNDPTLRARVLSKDVSWRRIHPIQRPAIIKDLDREGRCYCGDSGPPGFGWIRDNYQHLQDNGATMGFLRGITLLFLDIYAEASILFDWYVAGPESYTRCNEYFQKGNPKIF